MRMKDLAVCRFVPRIENPGDSQSSLRLDLGSCSSRAMLSLDALSPPTPDYACLEGAVSLRRKDRRKDRLLVCGAKNCRSSTKVLDPSSRRETSPRWLKGGEWAQLRKGYFSITARPCYKKSMVAASQRGMRLGRRLPPEWRGVAGNF